MRSIWIAVFDNASGVVFNAICDFIDIRLHQRLLRHHADLFKLNAGNKRHASEVAHTRRVAHRKFNGTLTHTCAAYRQRINSRLSQFLVKRAVGSAYAERRFCSSALVYTKRGIRHRLIFQRVDNHSYNTEIFGITYPDKCRQ